MTEEEQRTLTGWKQQVIEDMFTDVLDCYLTDLRNEQTDREDEYASEYYAELTDDMLEELICYVKEIRTVFEKESDRLDKLYAELCGDNEQG